MTHLIAVILFAVLLATIPGQGILWVLHRGDAAVVTCITGLVCGAADLLILHLWVWAALMLVFAAMMTFAVTPVGDRVKETLYVRTLVMQAEASRQETGEEIARAILASIPSHPHACLRVGCRECFLRQQAAADAERARQIGAGR